MGVGSTITKTVDRDSLERFILKRYWDSEVQSVQVNLWVRLLVIDLGWNHVVFEHEHRLDETSETSCTLSMTNVGLERADGKCDTVGLSILVRYRVSNNGPDRKALLLGLGKRHEDNSRAPFTSAVTTGSLGTVVKCERLALFGEHAQLVLIAISLRIELEIDTSHKALVCLSSTETVDGLMKGNQTG
ncbi:hypothetical protein HG531_005711 [Fusarium graminearum]|nr:hypothetical protein HG531_005711 [Fusarium graminearum]